MSLVDQRNQEASCYIGNLDEKVTEELLWELMLQAGPVLSVNMPKEKITGKHMGYGFAQFRSEDDAEYAIKVLNMIKLYSKPIKVNKCSVSQANSSNNMVENDIGANLFINNLDPMVDEKLLYDTFSSFGGIVNPPKIAVDEAGNSKGYGFISFDSFTASDLAIECMNGQYLSNRIISVQYSYKKDSPGVRHGTAAERMLASSQPAKFQPHTNFSSGAGDLTTMQTSGMAPQPPVSLGLPASGYLPPYSGAMGMPMMMPPMVPPMVPSYMQPPPLPAASYVIPPPPPHMSMSSYSIPPPPPSYSIPPPPPSYR